MSNNYDIRQYEEYEPSYNPKKEREQTKIKSKSKINIFNLLEIILLLHKISFQIKQTHLDHQDKIRHLVYFHF